MEFARLYRRCSILPKLSPRDMGSVGIQIIVNGTPWDVNPAALVQMPSRSQQTGTPFNF